jgi:hypothetical protein
MEGAMLSEFFLYSAYGSGTGLSGAFGTLSYPLTAPAATSAALAADKLAGKIDDEAATVAAYDELLAAVTGFRNTLAGIDVSDEEGATAAAQSIVDGYNVLLGTIAELTGTGGALAGDASAGQLVSALQSQLSASFAASGSFDHLHQIGIAPQTDGTLALDADAFAASYAEDAAGTASLLTETAGAFDAIAAPYAAGGGLIDSAANVFADNLLDLQSALPALEYMGDQTQTWADAGYAAAVAQLYSFALAESLFASWSAHILSTEA